MRSDRFPIRGLHAMWEEAGKPPRWTWAFLLVPLAGWSWWLGQALIMFPCAVVCLVFGEPWLGLAALGLSLFSVVMFLVDIDGKYPGDDREPSARLP
jgi:hypothetical protein